MSHATFLENFSVIYQGENWRAPVFRWGILNFLFKLSILVSVDVEKLLATYPACYTIHQREYRNTRPVSGLNTLKLI